MGWSRGSQLMSEVIQAVEKSQDYSKNIDPVILFQFLIEAFENYDCDTLNECLGENPWFDEAYEGVNPRCSYSIQTRDEE